MRVSADASPPEQGEAAPRTLAEKVEWLIQHMWPADQSPPKTNAVIANAVTVVTGEEISSTNVWKLRVGKAGNPTLKTLTALSTFFKVPINYFGDGEEAESVADQVALLALMRERGISRAALRSLADLSPSSREMIADMIQNSSRPNEIIYDPFCGSGSTILAAAQLKRIGYGCEVDPGYVAVELERLSSLGFRPELKEQS